MRLLHTTKLTFAEFFDSKVPPYCILSHRWGNDEVQYDDMITGNVDTNSDGFRKIVGSCRLAKQHRSDYIWIDTCCINKTSSAELTEAINAMHSYYEKAELCVAYLVDVPPLTATFKRHDQLCLLRKSAWFTRGWTLQELLAPSRLEFYDREFRIIGSKTELKREISDVTGIAGNYITGQRPLNEASIATRMSWASRRQTTRLEDEAYSLLGIFGVNMPLLYGEGNMAFFRLQREILANSDDESIFAWVPKRVRNDDEPFGMIAESPRDFSQSQNVKRNKASLERRPPFSLTNKGLEFQHGFSGNPENPKKLGPDEAHVGLACKRRARFNGTTEFRRVAIILRRIDDAWYRVECTSFHYTTEKLHHGHFRTFFVAQPNLKTTPSLSKAEGLDYIASIRRKAARKKQERKDMLKITGMFLGCAAVGMAFDEAKNTTR